MPSEIIIREGLTEPQSFRLEQIDPDTDIKSAVDITGYGSVSLFLSPEGGRGDNVTLSTTNGKISITSANPAADDPHGTFTFEVADLKATRQSYVGYFLVVDGGGNRIYFPSDDDLRFVILGRLPNDT
jgi:hypothetical protein